MPKEAFAYIYCAQITKEASLRFISHLDYAALIERAICRAKLPVIYSSGFNPHIRLSFASALALGVTSECEYLEFILSENICQTDVFERLSAQLPRGVTIKALKQTEGKHKALMALADQAEYRISFPLTDDIEAWVSAIRRFNEEQTSIYQRKTPKKIRNIDIKQYVTKDVQLHTVSDKLVLEMTVNITPQGSVKPSEVLDYLLDRCGLTLDVSSLDIKRTELLSGGRTLMDVL